MARPVVASPQAAEGIDAENGAHFIVAPDAWSEAEAVLALLAEPERAAALGRAAQARVRARYDWAETLAPLRTLLLGPGA